MKISELLNESKKLLSFEVFPPKTDTSFDSIKKATEEIAALSPAFMSVTYGAGGGTSRYTVDIAENIQRKYGVPTLAHLSCISSTRETVKNRISDMRAAGIENVMALRGDIPRGAENMPRDYRYASELVRELRESGADFCIGGACYPETHPESASRREDLIHLREKAEAGCDFLTTQMFFDNGLFYRFVEDAARERIALPIIPGIMPVTAFSQVERAVSLSGSFLPREFTDMVKRYEGDAASFKQAGIEYAVKQIDDLFENGVRAVHVYTMNKIEVAAAVMNNFLEVIVG